MRERERGATRERVCVRERHDSREIRERERGRGEHRA